MDARIESLLERHLPALRAFVQQKAGGELREREAVSDLVQSACREVLVYLDRHQVNDEEHFRRWLYQAALRKILDKNRYWRAEKRVRSREDDESVALVYRTLMTPSLDAARREDLARFEEALDALPDDYREVVFLAKLLELPHAEVARRMDRTEGAVRVLLYRALARLARALGDDVTHRPGTG